MKGKMMITCNKEGVLVKCDWESIVRHLEQWHGVVRLSRTEPMSLMDAITWFPHQWSDVIQARDLWLLSNPKKEDV